MEALILIVLIFLTSVPLVFFVSLFFWRRKYIDKKTGFKKCGVCGKVPGEIYYKEGLLFTKYQCREHSLLKK